MAKGSGHRAFRKQGPVSGRFYYGRNLGGGISGGGRLRRNTQGGESVSGGAGS